MYLTNLIWNFEVMTMEGRMIIDDTIEARFRVILKDH